MIKIDGSCHCGNITYTAVVDPEKVGICHCTDCQTLSGTAFRVSVAAAVAGLSGRSIGTSRTIAEDATPRRGMTFAINLNTVTPTSGAVLGCAIDSGGHH